MRLRQWKVPVDEAQIIAQVSDDALHDRLSAAAVRTLEIAVLDESNRCAGRTEDVITFGDRYRQLC